MEDWLTAYKIPIGKWIASFVKFLNEHAAFAFNAVSDGLGFLIDGLIDLMHATPPLLLVAIFAGARLLAAPLARPGRPGGRLAAADHEPGLLGRDRRDARARDLRHGPVHADRRADRHRGGAPAVAVHRDPPDPRPDADHSRPSST